MKRLWILFVCALASGCNPKPLSPSEFADAYAKEVIVSAGPSTKVEGTGELELEITKPNGEKLTAFLNNAYIEYQRDPTLLSDVLRTHVSGLLEPKNLAATTDKSRIIPVIKDRQWIDEVSQSMRSRGQEPIEHVYDEFNSELLVLYAEDTATNIRYLTPETLEETGIPREQLRSLAISNLNRLLPKVELHVGKEVSRISAGGDYEASLLLLEDVWEGGSITVRGEIVVAIPARDQLFVTGSKDARGINSLRAIASKTRQESSYSLTDELFVYRGGKFVPFDG